jgi:hypothetical protein
MAYGLGLIIYGSEGVGKTSLAIRLGSPNLCISIKETGWQDLNQVKNTPPDSANVNIRTYENLVKLLSSPPPGTKTVVIDSLSGFQELLFKYVTAQDFKGSKTSFNSFMNGPRQVAPMYASEFIEILNDLRNKGISVILVGHAIVDKEVDAMSEDYLNHVPDMDIGIRKCFTKWAQATLFMTLDVIVRDETTNKIKQTSKAQTMTRRVMYCEKTPGHMAKNRIGLPKKIKMGTTPDEALKNFLDALPNEVLECLE